MFRFVSFLLVVFLGSPFGWAEQWRAGAARVSITPDEAIWLGGYAARTRPSQGVAREIFARALALEDETGTRSVLVSIESLGFPAAFSARIAARASEQFGVAREGLLLNASHTHSAPALGDTLPVAYRMSAEEWEKVKSYTRWTEDRVVEVIGSAIERMAPARIAFGYARAVHAVNRRVPGPQGQFVIGANRLGPVDHRVPVLAVDSLAGRLSAVVFGYACHNTTLQGSNLEIHGDYSGIAQGWLEERFPDSVALFLAGTGGDANPHPRGTMELAEEHGRRLGRAVGSVLSGPLTSVDASLRTAFDTASIAFERIPTREEFEQRLEEEPANYFRRRHATMMLERLDEGPIASTYDYPIQVWMVGRELTLVALAGEVLLDYSQRLERERKTDSHLWVAGYSNDVLGYVPSRRVLQEGGYEPDISTVYYGLPSRFALSIEDTIVEKVWEMVERLEDR